ncbi:DUF6445 family protein [Enhygromyxa salina]|uniref:DUF6445 family protein n=1 Tax=Enhygromyxa salina TaxID=215803 RepID=UPI0004E6D448|nr:DUF6445 family protein [Enhygromyxa salina]
MRLELNSNRRVKVQRVAGSVIAVIDDTFVDIEQVREAALEHGYTIPDSGYPGLRARVSPIGGRAFVELLARVILDQLWPEGYPKAIDLDVIAADFYASALGLRERPPDLIDQHADHDVWLAAVTYLSDTDHDDEGTAFWRHRATGLTCWMSDKDPVELLWLQELLGLEFLAQLPAAIEALPRPDLQQLRAEIWRQRVGAAVAADAWEQLALVRQRCNRTVVYPGWQFHSAISRAVVPAPSRREQLRLSLGTFMTVPFAFANKPSYRREVYPTAAELGLPE